MKEWLLYPTISADMDFQMALDELLFRRMEKGEDSETLPIFRFFYSSGPWVTLGYSFKEGLPESVTAVHKRKYPVCRRMTGGGFVLHGQDLIFSLVARKSDDESFKTVRDSYTKIHEAVRRGFQSFGYKIDFFDSSKEWIQGKDCFRYPIETDLVYKGRKVAGGSQKRSAGVLLHQESIQGPRGFDMTSCEEKMIEGFEQVFDMKIRKATVHPVLFQQAEQLAEIKYR
ncbi:MAG: hypothetical protein JW893_03970 [Candidatus Omnitrophica bacterium]|nr:hypothetical protein [Candidatus Omnitrophota bacterium]